MLLQVTTAGKSVPARVAGERLLPLYAAPLLVADAVFLVGKRFATRLAVKNSTYSVERNLDYAYRSLI